MTRCLTYWLNQAQLQQIFLGEGGNVFHFILKSAKRVTGKKMIVLFFNSKTFVKASSKGILRKGQGSILGTTHRDVKGLIQ